MINEHCCALYAAQLHNNMFCAFELKVQSMKSFIVFL